ncbi:hypothetical protein Aperf_G00000125349 [Anoplocephala perfoliata]
MAVQMRSVFKVISIAAKYIKGAVFSSSLGHISATMLCLCLFCFCLLLETARGDGLVKLTPEGDKLMGNYIDYILSFTKHLCVCFHTLNETTNENYRLVTREMLAGYEAVQLMNKIFPSGDNLFDILITYPFEPNKELPYWRFAVGEPIAMLAPLAFPLYSGSPVDEPGLITYFHTIYCKLFPVKV